MKKFVFSLSFCLIFVAIAVGQTTEDHYKKIDYLTISQDQLEKFIQVADKEMTSGFEALLESDDIESWYLYKVKYPGGKKSNYNFVSVTTALTLKAFSHHFSDKKSPGFIPSTMEPKAEQHLTRLATLRKSEIWKVENAAFADSGGSPSRYMTMDYMKVASGKSPDYLMLEDEIAKPIHLERMDQGRMAGWEVYDLLLPGGMNYGYNFATGNYVNKLEHVEFGINEEIIRQTMGENSNVPELFETIYDTRDLVKVELWELVIYRQ